MIALASVRITQIPMCSPECLRSMANVLSHSFRSSIVLSRYRISYDMRDSERDRLALSVADRHCALEEPLAGDRRKYPIRQFQLFAEAVRCYVDKSRKDEMIHRNVARTVHGLADYLRLERKRVPAKVLFEAERLECLFFLGYDPQFDGNEPPDL